MVFLGNLLTLPKNLKTISLLVIIAKGEIEGHEFGFGIG